MKTVLHGLRWWERQGQAWCGPAAVGIITGKPMYGILQHFRRITKRKRILATYSDDIRIVLHRYGFRTYALRFDVPYGELWPMKRIIPLLGKAGPFKRCTESVAIFAIRPRRNRGMGHVAVWDRKAEAIADSNTGGAVIPQKKHRAWHKPVREIIFVWKRRRRV